MKKDCKAQSVEKDGGPLKLDGKPEVVGHQVQASGWASVGREAGGGC